MEFQMSCPDVAQVIIRIDNEATMSTLFPIPGNQRSKQPGKH